jgi:predicted nucleic acid-binding Zn ribbon protein
MRRLAPRPLARALEGVTATLAPATALARVQACWRDVVGEGVAEEGHPVAERDGVVTVACRSAVWAQELELMAPDLLDRLNQTLAREGRVIALTGLRFRVGSEP